MKPSEVRYTPVTQMVRGVDPGAVFCTECKHFRPEKTWATLWGALKRRAEVMGRCACPAVRQRPFPHLPIEEMPQCSKIRYGAQCDMVDPATEECEAKVVMAKLAGGQEDSGQSESWGGIVSSGSSSYRIPFFKPGGSK